MTVLFKSYGLTNPLQSGQIWRNTIIGVYRRALPKPIVEQVQYLYKN